MREVAVIAGAVAVAAALLGGVATWLVGTGYERAKAECAMAAAQQNAEIAGLRRQIEEGWRAAGDRINERREELADAVAAVDGTDGGTDVCLAGDSVRALDAIR